MILFIKNSFVSASSAIFLLWKKNLLCTSPKVMIKSEAFTNSLFLLDQVLYGCVFHVYRFGGNSNSFYQLYSSNSNAAVFSLLNFGIAWNNVTVVDSLRLLVISRRANFCVCHTIHVCMHLYVCGFTITFVCFFLLLPQTRWKQFSNWA